MVHCLAQGNLYNQPATQNYDSDQLPDIQPAVCFPCFYAQPPAGPVQRQGGGGRDQQSTINLHFPLLARIICGAGGGWPVDHFTLTESYQINMRHWFSGSTLCIHDKIRLNFEKLLRYHFALAA